MSVENIEYDHEWNVVTVTIHDCVEDAIAHATTKAGGPLHQAETQIGIELLDQATYDSIQDCGDYPLPGHPLWQISGREDDGSARELLEDDWRDGEQFVE